MKKNLRALFIGLCTFGLLVAGCSKGGGETPSSTSDNLSEESQTSDSAESESNSEESSDTLSESEDESESGSETTPPEDPIKVLFLGNSLIFFNDMPVIFKNLATAAGKEVYVDSVTQGSCTMSLLATSETDIGFEAQRKLTSESWDYVIIEPSRRASPFEDSVLEAEIDAAEILDEFAVAAGAETLIYAVWGNEEGQLTAYKQDGYSTVSLGSRDISRSAHANFMMDFSEKVSQRLGGRKIIKAGYAFENTIAANPEINLYNADHHHPSPAGSYLVACTVFGTIYGERTLDVPYTYDLSFAKALQQRADETMIDNVVPTLDPIPTGEEEDIYSQHVLIIGAPTTFLEYNPGDQYEALMDGLGEKVKAHTLSSGSHTIKQLASPTTSEGSGLRSMLEETNFDAIFIQISRRATTNSPEVTLSEKNHLALLKELLHAETDNIYIYAPRGESTQKTFIDEGENYTSTGEKDPAGGLALCQFYSELAVEMATIVGGKPLNYVAAYQEFKNTSYWSPLGEEGRKNAVRYLHACCFYNVMYEESIPSEAKWQCDLENEPAEAVRAAAEKYCL